MPRTDSLGERRDWRLRGASGGKGGGRPCRSGASRGRWGRVARLLAMAGSLFAGGAAGAPPAELDEAPLRASNGIVTVGIHRAMGGAISWLSWTGHPGNVVNHHDPGRLVQQSYYAGQALDRRAEGQHAAWSPWPWNPIQGGGVASWARLAAFEQHRDGTLFGTTILRLWDMPNEDAAARMRQWTGFDPALPNVVVVRCEFVSCREPGDRWGPPRRSPQEVPAAYFIRSFESVRTYLGERAWRDEQPPLGPPWSRATAPRHAMAAFDSAGRGVAVFSPAGGHHWNFGLHGTAEPAGPHAAPCLHVAPIAVVPIGPRSVYRYRFWLIVGDAGQIGVALDELWRRHGRERAEFVPSPPDPSATETACAAPFS